MCHITQLMHVQALGLLVEVQGRRFAHRAPAVLRLVLGVLRGHEATAEAEDVEELRVEQLHSGGGDAEGDSKLRGPQECPKNSPNFCCIDLV